MTGYVKVPGKMTVAPEVLTSITRTATLEVDGVLRMAPVPGGVNRLFQRGNHDGVQLHVEDGIVSVDLYVVLSPDVNIREISRTIQAHVSRAVTEMMGMDVGRINVHIEDIDHEA